LDTHVLSYQASSSNEAFFLPDIYMVIFAK